MARLQNRLKELRKAKNLTQQQLADIMEVSVYTVSLWERGGTRPEKKTLEKVAHYFNVSTDYLEGISFERNTNTAESEEAYASCVELEALFRKIARLSESSRKLVQDSVDKFYIADDATNSLNDENMYTVGVTSGPGWML